MVLGDGWHMDATTAVVTRVEFRALGPIEVVVDGCRLDIGGSRQRRVLALLLSRAGMLVESDVLAEYLWDDAERPANAADTIRTYVSRLRRSLSDAGLDAATYIVTQPPGYRLDPGEAMVDADVFEQRVLDARAMLDQGDAARTLNALDDALAQWRGIPYQEFADLPWAQREVARLEELHRVALEQRAEARLALGAHAEVVGELEQLVADDPLRARSVELLMSSLYQSGRQADAMRAAAAHHRAAADIGLEAAPSVRELEARIASADAELAPTPASADTIRGYRLSEKIGEGAFSIVYRSVQPSLGREVAVKQIRAELADRADRVHVESGTVLGQRFPTSELTFGPSVGDGGGALVTGTPDHLLVWDLTPGDWADIACRAAGRNMTREEWEQFSWSDEPYRRTCAEWPAATTT